MVGWENSNCRLISCFVAFSYFSVFGIRTWISIAMHKQCIVCNESHTRSRTINLCPFVSTDFEYVVWLSSFLQVKRSIKSHRNTYAFSRAISLCNPSALFMVLLVIYSLCRIRHWLQFSIFIFKYHKMSI